MKTRRLSQQEINQLKEIPDTVERQKQYQKWSVDLFSSVKSLILNLFPRAGKTFAGKLAFERFRKVSDAPILVICPKKPIAQEWLRVCGDIENLHVRIINTCVNEYTDNPVSGLGMVVYDEIHNYANPASLHFSRIFDLTPCKFRLGLSGSLEQKHLNYLESKGFYHRFEIPLKVGRELELIADYMIWNVVVPLTLQEQEEYVKIQQDYLRYLAIFEPHFPDKTPVLLSCCVAGIKKVKYEGVTQTGNEWARWVADQIGWQQGQVIGTCMKWQGVVSRRTHFLHSVENKFILTDKLLDYFTEEQVIVFHATKKQAGRTAKKDPRGVAYYSGLADKVLEKNEELFQQGIKPHIISCKSLSEGFSAPGARFAIKTSFNSTEKNEIQTLGRLLIRSTHDKESTVINLVADDFVHQGKLYASQEKKWLDKAQRNEPFVRWMNEEELFEQLERISLQPV